MRIRPLLSPIEVVRAALDVTLIGTWIWLASESLPQPLPALGAALFGAASAGYWAMHARGHSLPETEQDNIPRDVELGRLTRFTNRPAREPVPSKAEWFNDPEIGHRMQAEADRCAKLGMSMTVIFLRTRPGSLAELADGTPPKNLAEVLPQLLDGSWQKHLSSANGREAVIALNGGDRATAGELLQKLRHHLEPLECDAGIVVYPEEGVDSAALVSLARLRLQPFKTDRSTLGASTGPAHARHEEPPLARTSIPHQETDDLKTAVS